MTTLLDIFMSDCFFMIDFTNSWIVHDILMQGKLFILDTFDPAIVFLFNLLGNLTKW